LDIFQKTGIAEESSRGVQAHYEDLVQRKEFLSSEIESLDTIAGVESKLRERYSIANRRKSYCSADDEDATITEDADVGWWRRVWSWMWK